MEDDVARVDGADPGSRSVSKSDNHADPLLRRQGPDRSFGMRHGCSCIMSGVSGHRQARERELEAREPELKVLE